MKNMRIRSLFTALLTVLFIGATGSANASAAPILEFSPSVFDVSEGDTFVLEITGAGFDDLYAYQFDLTFDPALLAAVSIDEGGFLSSLGDPTFFIPGFIDNVTGTILFTANTLIGPITGISGDGVLATVTFTAVAAGLTAVHGTNALLLNSLGDAELVADFSADVRVVGTSVPEPTSLLLMLMGLGLCASRNRLLQRPRERG